MKKLLTILAIALTYQCVAQGFIDLPTTESEVYYIIHVHESNLDKISSELSVDDIGVLVWEKQEASGIVKGANTSLLKVGTIVLDENIHGAVRNATFAEELLFLLQDYETECYNDSTYVEYLEYHSPPSYTDSITGASYVYTVYYPPTKIKEWQHKEPTFKGFIEWLEKNRK